MPRPDSLHRTTSGTTKGRKECLCVLFSAESHPHFGIYMIVPVKSECVGKASDPLALQPTAIREATGSGQGEAEFRAVPEDPENPIKSTKRTACKPATPLFINFKILLRSNWWLYALHDRRDARNRGRKGWVEVSIQVSALDLGAHSLRWRLSIASVAAIRFIMIVVGIYRAATYVVAAIAFYNLQEHCGEHGVYSS